MCDHLGRDRRRGRFPRRTGHPRRARRVLARLQLSPAAARGRRRGTPPLATVGSSRCDVRRPSVLAADLGTATLPLTEQSGHGAAVAASGAWRSSPRPAWSSQRPRSSPASPRWPVVSRRASRARLCLREGRGCIARRAAVELIRPLRDDPAVRAPRTSRLRLDQSGSAGTYRSCLRRRTHHGCGNSSK
jgi:hypothetical protein